MNERQRMADTAELEAYCLSLPGARSDFKWGGVQVFSIAGNKMFAVLDLHGSGNLAFKVDDELYLCKFHGDHQTLLHTHWSDPVGNFLRDHWMKDTGVQPVLYIHGHGAGQVLYLTLGHCRGKYDMQPYIEEYPVREEGAWKTDEFYELLRRGIRWAMEPLL